MIKYCKNCKKEILVKPSRHKAGKDNYCSRECYQDTRNKKQTIICTTCGKEFEEYPSRIKDNRGKFCSQECYFEDKRKNQIVCTCSLCGNKFRLCNSEYDARKDNQSSMIFCSNECYHNYNVGENVYNWSPDTNELIRIRKSRNYLDWRTSVFERDDYTCQCCGIRGKILHSHHIEGFANNPELRLDINNGITLCMECHREYHNIYGVKDINKTNFYNWLDLRGEQNE